MTRQQTLSRLEHRSSLQTLQSVLPFPLHQRKADVHPLTGPNIPTLSSSACV